MMMLRKEREEDGESAAMIMSQYEEEVKGNFYDDAERRKVGAWRK